MYEHPVGIRRLGWLPGFLLALPLAIVWVIGALMAPHVDGPAA